LKVEGKIAVVICCTFRAWLGKIELQHSHGRSCVVSSLTDADVELSFSSNLIYLDMVQEVSDRISESMGFEDDSKYWIGLSVREAVTNAIQHGNQNDRKKKVLLRFKIGADRLQISVKDQGEGIDESEIPDPLDPENLLKPGGRGIFFIRSFMDSVGFSSCPEGGYELTMEKLRNEEHQGEDNDN
jgi:serine/threonine-protein kinase RsbW